MKDIIINIQNRTRAVTLNSDILGVVGENLQGRFIIDFEKEFIHGACFLLCDMPNGESGYIPMDKDATNKIYTAPIKSSLLTVAGDIRLQVKITENSIDDEIPIFKSEVFTMTVESGIDAQTVTPEVYPDWETVANAKLAEVEKAIEQMNAIAGNMYSFLVKPSNKADGVSKVWQAVSETRYKIKVLKSEFGLVKPYIDDCIVYLSNGAGEKSILDMIELLNGDILIYSNLEIDCKIILKGE